MTSKKPKMPAWKAGLILVGTAIFISGLVYTRHNTATMQDGIASFIGRLTN